mmetsp:Transcript_25834/g.76927  ORF Transcript_25834/g.76927 Transcript_25834/m.76927 type:complete len:204 (-) Transcript_25834:227-838(-)
MADVGAYQPLGRAHKRRRTKSWWWLVQIRRAGDPPDLALFPPADTKLSREWGIRGQLDSTLVAQLRAYPPIASRLANNAAGGAAAGGAAAGGVTAGALTRGAAPPAASAGALPSWVDASRASSWVFSTDGHRATYINELLVVVDVSPMLDGSPAIAISARVLERELPLANVARSGVGGSARESACSPKPATRTCSSVCLALFL